MESIKLWKRTKISKKRRRRHSVLCLPNSMIRSPRKKPKVQRLRRWIRGPAQGSTRVVQELVSKQTQDAVHLFKNTGKVFASTHPDLPWSEKRCNLNPTQNSSSSRDTRLDSDILRLRLKSHHLAQMSSSMNPAPRPPAHNSSHASQRNCPCPSSEMRSIQGKGFAVFQIFS